MVIGDWEWEVVPVPLRGAVVVLVWVVQVGRAGTRQLRIRLVGRVPGWVGHRGVGELNGV